MARPPCHGPTFVLPVIHTKFVKSATSHFFGRSVLKNPCYNSSKSLACVSSACGERLPMFACLIPRYRVHNTGMRIGELARHAAVNIQTIRFYERRGLLPAPLRNNSGYRSYEKSDLDRVTFIKRNQELGFTLEEIKQILDLHRVVAAMTFPLSHKPSELSAIIAIGRERLETINQKVRTLRAMELRLTSILLQLEAATVATCPASKPARKIANRK